jgi:hypothetical protein
MPSKGEAAGADQLLEGESTEDVVEHLWW